MAYTPTKAEEKMDHQLQELSSAIERYPEGEEKQKMIAAYSEVIETADEMKEQARVQDYLAGYSDNAKDKDAARASADASMERMTEGIRKMTDRVNVSGKAEEFGKTPEKSPAATMREEGAKICRDVAEKDKKEIEAVRGKSAKESPGVIEEVAHRTPVVKNVVKTVEAFHKQNQTFFKMTDTIWQGMKDFIDPKRQDKMKTVVDTCVKATAYGAEYLARAATAQATFGAQIGVPAVSIATGTKLIGVGDVAQKGIDMIDKGIDRADEAIEKGGMTGAEKGALISDLKGIEAWAKNEAAPMLKDVQGQLAELQNSDR